MSERGPIQVELFLDGKLHGLRSWHAVPPRGDTVIVRRGSEDVAAEVLRVVWLYQSEPREGTKVDLYLTSEPQARARGIGRKALNLSAKRNTL